MFQRAIFKQLREWASREKRKPLILRGARQVGKTTVVHEFGKEFDNYLYVNLEREEDAILFDGQTSDVSSILQAIYFLKRQQRREGRTLLFIDEIQCVPKAVALLRYFYEDLPEIYVIAAGSVLQSLLRQRISFPVGRVEYMSLRPCSFVEFLEAMGEHQFAEVVGRSEVHAMLHEAVMRLFRQYSLIGGMPEVVAHYAAHKDLVGLEPIYDSLLTGYNEDVEKYAANRTQVEVIRWILERGWQMAGQTITLGGFAGSSYKAREVSEAFGALEKAFLLELAYPVVSTELPLLPAMRRAPKLLWLDGGIVNYAAKVQQEVFSARDLLDAWRGNIAEQWVAQELAAFSGAVGYGKRYFWVRNTHSSMAKVDFVYQDGMRIIPIEVKAGSNAHLRSLHQYMDESTSDVAVRVWSGAYSVDDVKTPSGKMYRLVNLPFYYVGSLPQVLKGL
ncbi:MAG: AAA family ATPase [Mediterranea sp.]|nr:AAA family ATPase [Mediterranea sp.]